MSDEIIEFELTEIEVNVLSIERTFVDKTKQTDSFYLEKRNLSKDYDSTN